MDLKIGDIVVVKTEKELIESGYFSPPQNVGYMKSLAPDSAAGFNQKMFSELGKKLVIKNINQDKIVYFLEDALDYKTLDDGWIWTVYMLKRVTKQLDIDFGD